MKQNNIKIKIKLPAAIPIFCSVERTFHRTERAVKERRILTNVLLSKVEEREQM